MKSLPQRRAEGLDLVPGSIFPSHHLSQVLNEGCDQFYDFVNAWVEAAKQRLKRQNYHHYSILAIGLGVGLRTKRPSTGRLKKWLVKRPSEFVREENVSSRSIKVNSKTTCPYGNFRMKSIENHSTCNQITINFQCSGFKGLKTPALPAGIK